MIRVLTSLLLFLVLSPKVMARVVITEVMFDLDGSEFYDEFVELQNVGSESVNLTGWMVDDGDEVDALVPRSAGMVLDPGGFALILDSGYFDHSNAYDPLPSSALILTIEDATFGKGGFQNEGSDRVLLVSASGDTVESVAYSPGNAEGFSEEKIDQIGDISAENWADSRWKFGTPGRVNSVSPKSIDLSLVTRSVSPILVRSGESVRFQLTVVNEGKAISGKYEVVVTGPVSWSRTYISLGAGESNDIEYTLPSLSPGRHAFEAYVNLDGDEDPLNNTVGWSAVAGALPQQVLINEVMAAPDDGGPEWVELVNPSGQDVDVSGWRITDSRGGEGAKVEADIVSLPSGFYLVLTKDLSQFHLHNPTLRSVEVVSASGWPTLNDGGDQVVLQDATGEVIDRMSYGSTVLGRSIERIDVFGSSDDLENWHPNTSETGSTPGEENSVAKHPTEDGVELQESPNPFKDRVEISYVLPSVTATVNLWVFDRAGRRVKVILNAESGGSRRSVWWDGTGEGGRGLKPGMYNLYGGHFGRRGFSAASPGSAGTRFIDTYSRNFLCYSGSKRPNIMPGPPGLEVVLSTLSPSITF